jgi:hypothetical protein
MTRIFYSQERSEWHPKTPMGICGFPSKKSRNEYVAGSPHERFPITAKKANRDLKWTMDCTGPEAYKEGVISAPTGEKP